MAPLVRRQRGQSRKKAFLPLFAIVAGVAGSTASSFGGTARHRACQPTSAGCRSDTRRHTFRNVRSGTQVRLPIRPLLGSSQGREQIGRPHQVLDADQAAALRYRQPRARRTQGEEPSACPQNEVDWGPLNFLYFLAAAGALVAPAMASEQDVSSRLPRFFSRSSIRSSPQRRVCSENRTAPSLTGPLCFSSAPNFSTARDAAPISSNSGFSRAPRHSACLHHASIPEPQAL